MFKIVQDKQEPISDMYSQGIKDLINLLLIKDETARPKVIDIIRLPFVKEHMERFVQSSGKINANPKLQKKKTNLPAMAEKMN